MLKKVGFTIALGLLISYPLVAATASDTRDLAKPTKLATLRIAVDQETGVTYTELLGDYIPNKAGGPGTWGNCNADLQIHKIAGQSTVCPTCNNCPDPEDKTRGEILFFCLCFQPQTDGMMVIPTAGQKYGFELVPYSGGHLHGSAVSATHEIVCAQRPAADGYEFDLMQHCGIAVSVEVDGCGAFEVWYDVVGTLWK
ncbi:MAG: hypothetical protein GY719_03940 [bacterium]|nr:hypothetical protein [bacterium]